MSLNSDFKWVGLSFCKLVAATGLKPNLSALNGCVKAIIFCLVAANPIQSIAQSANDDFIDAFANVEGSASDFHSERFNAAEKALLEGLSTQGSDRLERGKKPSLHTVSTTQSEIKKAQTSQTVSDSVLDDDRGVASQKTISAPANLDNSYRANTGVRDDRLDALPVIAEDVESKLSSSKVGKSRPVGSSGELKGSTERGSIKATTINTQKVKGDIAGDKIGDKSLLSVKGANFVKDQAKSKEEAKATDYQQQISALKRELAEAKSSLAAAELEISRLSSVMQGQTKARFNLGSGALSGERSNSNAQLMDPKVANTKMLPQGSNPQPNRSPVSSKPAPPPPTQDLQVATVAVDKAELRLGPGNNNSALMTLSRGSRLAVEARQGEWYRVFAPNGQRAWIRASLVRFGDGAASFNDGSSVNIMGFNSHVQ